MTETATEDSSDKEDPQHTGDNAGSMSVTTDEGASADETQILSASTVAENSNLTSELMYLNIRHHKVGQGCRRRN